MKDKKLIQQALDILDQVDKKKVKRYVDFKYIINELQYYLLDNAWKR